MPTHTGPSFDVSPNLFINQKHMNFTYFLWTFTSVTALVLLSYAVEQLGKTYTVEIARRQAELDKLDSYLPTYE